MRGIGQFFAAAYVVVSAAGAWAAAPQHETAYQEQPSVYKVHSQEIVLAPGEGLEVKYHFDQGSTMLYSWDASAVVPFEFHGVPDEIPPGEPPDYYESHEKDDDGKSESHGVFVSPSTGIHGWYWENTRGEDVTIRLRTAGFYNSALEFSAAGERELAIQDAQ